MPYSHLVCFAEPYSGHKCSLNYKAPFLWKDPLKSKKQQRDIKHMDFKTDMRYIRSKSQRWEKSSPNSCNLVSGHISHKIQNFLALGTCFNKEVKITKRTLLGLHDIFWKILTENQILSDTSEIEATKACRGERTVLGSQRLAELEPTI